VSIKRFWVGYFKNQLLCIVHDYLLAKLIPGQIGYQVLYCFRDAKSAQSVCTNFQISVIWYTCDIEPLSFFSFFSFKNPTELGIEKNKINIRPILIITGLLMQGTLVWPVVTQSHEVIKIWYLCQFSLQICGFKETGLIIIIIIILLLLLLLFIN